MSEMTRREWGGLALAGIAGLAVPTKKIDSKFNGVLIGAQSYSFRDRSLDDLIAAMAEIGIGSCELWQGHIEPRGSREEVRQWRMSVPLDHFKQVRAKFDRAGVELYAYNLSFRDDFTDAEIERGFEMARALGVSVMTASSNVSTARRIDQFAKRYRMRVGMHNHSNVRDPNEFATPDSFARAMEGASNYIAINLDIGHFTAANFDAVDFLNKHHDRIVTLHIKDRRRDQGPNVPFGEGDTPIKQVLDLMRRKRWSFPANIEYEYPGKDTIAEVRRCLDYCKKALGV
ncbi:MAG TPA: sugar phosphate isomerase/epimerase [Blastocatellia bacterium]|nr:sugar phosphate isomerase/epimerase [Blastocatellia bacterium]